jgi:copper(I)-binding protein
MLAAGLCAASLSACAADCSPQVRNGWIRKPPADLPMLAAYARIENTCATAAVVVSARSPAFDAVSLHASTIEGGMSRMRAMDQLRIGPGKTAEFAPGGMHLMLMQPRQSLRAGEHVPIEFTLQDGRTVRGDFEVKGPRAVK